MKLLFGMDKQVCDWAARLIPHKPNDGAKAIGFVRDDKLVAAAIFDNWRPDNQDVEFSFAGEGNWANRQAMASIYKYAFGQLKCKRVTAHTAVSNLKAQKLLTDHLGFVCEGRMREIFGNEDAFIFGLLKRDVPKWTERYL